MMHLWELIDPSFQPASQRLQCIYIVAALEGCIKTKIANLTRMADNEKKCHVSAVLVDIHDFSATIA